ncbi:MAG TPA: dehydrogenase E1 component subunit alpha/beta [Vicinamibacterales bacterium]|jgi:2-oxoisovalerate dehydrogenase E1 component|nr:dehydrogenase E1 component subunit alpha/beta [Vicinamibacterales bacterium]
MKASTRDRAQTYEGLTRDDLLTAYRWMLLSRRLDDKEIQLKNQSQIFFQISGAGHEAVLVAAGLALKPGYDWFFPYYRDRALALMLGISPYEMLLAAVGSKDDPASGGRMMPSHWSKPSLHIVNGSSATGTQCLHAAGCAEGSKRLPALGGSAPGRPAVQDDEVTYVSIGDGATGEGEFWEFLNTISSERLPVVCVVEDNGYAISCPAEFHTAGGDVSRLIEGFPNLEVIRVDGTDFVQSVRAMREAVAYARARKGPALVHAKVVRPYSHSHSDDERLYKPAEERALEATRDPIAMLAQFLKSESLAVEDDLTRIRREVDGEISEAAELALKAPRPPADSAGFWVYSPDVDPASDQFSTPAHLQGKPETMVTLLNRTLHDEMSHNPRMVVFGQDVADASRGELLEKVPGKGGVFKVTHGLQRVFGSERCFNSPLAEANIVGRAIGMAVRGIKPVVEIQFFDYIWPAMMQIRDELSMLRYRSANTWAAPVVIRVAIGGYLRGGGVYHSQSGESIFAHCPGLRIVFPSNAADAAGLLRTSIRCDDPVMFLEHKHLYRQTYNKSEYPGPDYQIPFARAAERRPGTDLVIITWGAVVQRSLVAAQRAEKTGISVGVIDLRTIIPYDWPSIAEAVRQTNRVIVAHEDQLTCGFGAEIAARISEELFEHLDAPVTRVAAMDTPVAYAPELEEAILPQIDDIVKAIEKVAAY